MFTFFSTRAEKAKPLSCPRYQENSLIQRVGLFSCYGDWTWFCDSTAKLAKVAGSLSEVQAKKATS